MPVSVCLECHDKDRAPNFEQQKELFFARIKHDGVDAKKEIEPRQEPVGLTMIYCGKWDERLVSVYRYQFTVVRQNMARFFLAYSESIFRKSATVIREAKKRLDGER